MTRPNNNVPGWLGHIRDLADDSHGLTACPPPEAIAARLVGMRPYPFLGHASHEVDLRHLPGMPPGQVILPVPDGNIHSYMPNLFKALRARGIGSISCLGCSPRDPAREITYRYPTTEALAAALEGEFHLAERIYLDLSGTFIAQDLSGDFLQLRASASFLQEILGSWGLVDALQTHLGYLRASLIPGVRQLADEIDCFNQSVLGRATLDRLAD